ncbi:MAG: hypothetical protein OCU18_08850, partial [Candidatus Syntrophoarchaeum sp.]|nr:hypothetical protein [Candidatus Syntrophoarchaeum sp.]
LEFFENTKPQMIAGIDRDELERRASQDNRSVVNPPRHLKVGLKLTLLWNCSVGILLYLHSMKWLESESTSWLKVAGHGWLSNAMVTNGMGPTVTKRTCNANGNLNVADGNFSG